MDSGRVVGLPLIILVVGCDCEPTEHRRERSTDQSGVVEVGCKANELPNQGSGDIAQVLPRSGERRRRSPKAPFVGALLAPVTANSTPLGWSKTAP